MSKVWLRAAALALAAVGIIAGLTVYFSAESLPPCLVSGVQTWRAPTDKSTHHYEVVFLDRAACFFDMDDRHRLVGGLRLSRASGISVAAPVGQDVGLRTEAGLFTLDVRSGRLRSGGRAPVASDTLTVSDEEHGVAYATQRGLLGFRVLNLRTGRNGYAVGFRGFTWNRGFGPNPPSHGLSLAPDRPELWVLDAPNSVVHVFDVSGVPSGKPREIDDIRLSKPISGNENPCQTACGRIGSLRHGADGRFVYVGDSGDVIDAQTRQRVANLEALHNSRVLLELDWVNGQPFFPSRR
jgi:hypothetical protein